ncbi:ribosome-releasing factor 2, mitochondrial-like [Gigantopelta aegis]|uniref:ribosome-releasing factor 2, mitochondrial-like n=1 Tax=Gigantopelta aegis TaxID=1735272 RepID=UPI001B88BED5|nr:ribosome-releasing factor 2, mitochondrial-like [Gigantopelta aegis]
MIRVLCLRQLLGLPQLNIFIADKLAKVKYSRHLSRGALFGCQYRMYSTANVDHEDMSKIRNIGIMAHIDAGKTTTTERMLYYSGLTRHLGDVDDGDTVMDYMEQERERGITITSAAITFHWDHHKVNLIDTPGHVDFTVEVERSLRVLDGAVAVLDASAGVEAQTLTVWRQADRYSVPRMVYLNKMDKPGASVGLCLSSIKQKLKVQPLLLNAPIGTGREFEGVVDVIMMEKLVWNSKICEDGIKFEKKLLSQSDGKLYEDALKARHHLIGQLADIDDSIADLVLADTKLDDIQSEAVRKAVRSATIQQKIIPVLCGSSLKNKGVQPLLDAVNLYLPSPMDVHHSFIDFYRTDLCALAFKVIHNKQRGPLTFLRLYAGALKSGSTVYNINRQCSEKTSRILQVYADDFQDMSTAVAGNIVLIAGLKQTYTGDTITSSQSSARAAAREFHKTKATDARNSEELGAPILAGVEVPTPVFFCSVEPPTMALQKQLDFALECLQKEDPSLKVDVDKDSGQTILSGMGELHLDIIRSRIANEYNVDVDLGPLQIAYRETATESTEVEEILDKKLGDRHHLVKMKISLHPDPSATQFKHVILMSSREENLDHVKKHQLKAIESGIQSGITNGPVLNFPVINVTVHLHSFHLGPGTSIAMVSACAAQAVHKALKQANTVLLEPMMILEINTDEDKLHGILSDLAQRRSHVDEIQSRQDTRVVRAITPLAELMGYSTAIRTISSGMATFTMELSHYEQMMPLEQAKAIERVTGFAPVL